VSDKGKVKTEQNKKLDSLILLGLITGKTERNKK
jgi:hypothetical protein